MDSSESSLLNLRSAERQRRFLRLYKAFEVTKRFRQRLEIEEGGKILLPGSALRELMRLNIPCPMLFKLTNRRQKRSTHAGVLEFVADEGRCYMPSWLMKNLQLANNKLVIVEHVKLPIATYARFQPLNMNFLQITDPKAVLEMALRNFACLTTGDVLAIIYMARLYELRVLEVRPRKAVNIIECDMQVDFELPEESQSALIERNKSGSGSEMKAGISRRSIGGQFTGQGVRLDGKALKHYKSHTRREAKKGIVPDHNFRVGTLTFDRNIRPISDRSKVNEVRIAPSSPEVHKFAGQGYQLTTNAVEKTQKHQMH